MRTGTRWVLLAAIAGCGTASFAGTIQPGDLVVYRTGDGTTTYGGTGGTAGSVATPVFIDEYTTSGTLVQSIPMPTSVNGSNLMLTGSGTATSEGMLTLSANGKYIVATGYNAAVGTAGVASTTTSAAARVVGRIDLNGNVDTTTGLTDAYSGNNIRGVTSVDGSSFYVSGTASSGGGVRLVNLGGSTTTQITPTGGTTNVRGVATYFSRLYFSSGSGTAGIKTYTDPLPTNNTGQTESAVAASPSSYQFVILDMDANAALSAGDRLYFADDSANTGGLFKSVYDGSNWGSPSNVALAANLRGLTGTVVNGNAVLYGTEFANSVVTTGSNSSFSTSIVSLTDTGTPSFTTLASFSGSGTPAVVLEGFRGIALIPVAAPEPATLGLLAPTGLLLLARRRRARRY